MSVRHLWQLKTVVFLQLCIIRGVLLIALVKSFMVHVPGLITSSFRREPDFRIKLVHYVNNKKKFYPLLRANLKRNWSLKLDV